MDAAETSPRPDLRIIISRGFQSNTYLLATGVARECVVIDPGLDHEVIEQAIALSGWQPVAVFTSLFIRKVLASRWAICTSLKEMVKSVSVARSKWMVLPVWASI